MIPWVREKFAERRAKWLAARNKRSTTKSEDEDDNSSTSTSDIAPRLHRLQDNPEETANSDATTVAAVAAVAAANASRTTQAAHRSMRGSSATVTHCHHHHHSSSCSLTNSTSTNIKLNKIRGSRRNLTTSSITSGPNSEEAIKGSATKERIKVRVICPSARVLAFQTDVNRRLLELKTEILLELKDDMGSMPLFATDPRLLGPRFRLIKADYQGSELNESLTMAQLEIFNNDTLVLVTKRSFLHNIISQTRETRMPQEVEIEMATRSLPEHSSDIPMVDINEIFQQSNLQFDVRKVLISLAQASAFVIGAGPYANRLIAMLKQRLINKRNYQNDTLQCLVEMGFKKEKAEYALKMHNNIYSNALEWLIQRQSQDMSVEEAVMGIPRTSSVASPSGIMSNDENPMDNIGALLEIVRIYSHRDIPPSAETIQTLVDMGFEEAEVIEALKKTCNNKAAACEWLCGNRSGSLVELREGLSQDSPILKTILELPQVQLSLSNPKILLAFLAILENEQSIRVWGGDNDTTSVITHILQKYHEEKHVLGINQFYSSR